MTTFDEPRIDHHGQCTSWKTDDVTDCDCRDNEGHGPRSWAEGPLCAFDIESTGVNPLTARLVTATVVRIRPGRPVAVTNWLSDVAGEDIPDEAAKIHGVSTEHARAHGRPLADVVDEIRVALELEWAAGIPVVGHNISYDFTVLAAECVRIGMASPFTITGPVLDSLVMDRAVDRRRKGKRTLTAACAVYGVTLSDADAHSSDADALASARLAWKIAKRYPLIGGMPMPALMQWQADRHRAWANSFGAYLVKQGKVDDVARDWPLRSTS